MANPSYKVGPDRFMGTGDADAPSRYATAIAPSDTVAVAIGPGGVYAKALYVGVSGDLTIIAAGDNTNGGLGTPVTLKNHPVGYVPVQTRAVMATGTTASLIVGLAD